MRLASPGALNALALVGGIVALLVVGSSPRTPFAFHDPEREVDVLSREAACEVAKELLLQRLGGVPECRAWKQDGERGEVTAVVRGRERRVCLVKAWRWFALDEFAGEGVCPPAMPALEQRPSSRARLSAWEFEARALAERDRSGAQVQWWEQRLQAAVRAARAAPLGECPGDVAGEGLLLDADRVEGLGRQAWQHLTDDRLLDTLESWRSASARVDALEYVRELPWLVVVDGDPRGGKVLPRLDERGSSTGGWLRGRLVVVNAKSLRAVCGARLEVEARPGPVNHALMLPGDQPRDAVVAEFHALLAEGVQRTLAQLTGGRVTVRTR